MSGKSNLYQVVFLLDVSIGIKNSENDEEFESILNKTRLSALKVLTFLEDTLPQSNKSNLKWGFKFFNFRTFKTCIERYEFKDFSIRTFEQFESLLENKSVAERTQFKDYKKSDHQKPKGSLFALSNALKEIVTDYQWDFPDITSPVRPVRRQRGSRNVQPEDPGQHNFVFVLGPCPGTINDWKRFASKPGSSDDGDVSITQPQAVRETILPPLVSRLFRDHKKIQLFWIDTNIRPALGDPVADHLFGPKLIHKVLRSLGGGLIPVHAVLQLESMWNTRVETIYQKLVEDDTSLELKSEDRTRKLGIKNASDFALPLSVVMNYYLGWRLQLPSVAEQSCTLLIRKGEDLKEVCKVVLKIILKDVRYSRLPPQKTTEEKGKVLQVQVPGVSFDTQTNQSPGKSVELCTPTEPKSLIVVHSEENSSPMNVPDTPSLEIRGTLNSGEIPLEHLQPNNVYMIQPKEAETNATLFRLLKHLASKRLILVVDVSLFSGQYDLPSLAVLQVLTLSSATLTFIKSNVTSLVEKLMTFSGVQSDIGEETRKFVNKSVESLCRGQRKRVIKSEAVVSKENFSSAMCEGWLKSGVISRSTDILKAEISRESIPEDEENNLLKKLKKFYREERLNKTHHCSSAFNGSKKESSRKSSGDFVGKGGTGKTRLSHSRSFTAPSKVAKNLGARTVRIMNQAKQEVERREETSEGDVSMGRDSGAPQGASGLGSIQSVDINTEEELVKHVRDCYDKSVSGQTDALTTSQGILQVALHFFRMKQTESLHVTAREFVQKSLCISSNEMRNKYKQQLNVPLDDKVKDYELQVLLRLELESIIYSSEGPEEGAYDDLVDEMARLLRAVSFIQEPGYTSEFLGKTVAESYAATLPKLVQELFDEMGQPLPSSFDSLFSPDALSSNKPNSVKSDNPSVVTDSVYNFMRPSSDRSLRSRSFRKLPSFTATAPTNRQIVVGKQAGAQKKEKKAKEEKRRTRTSTGVLNTKNVKSPKTETVRRNLFTESGLGSSRGGVKLERRQSVAVMESSRKPRTPRKSPRRSSARTPKVHHILKTKIVVETPRHKQVSRLSRGHSRCLTAPDVGVVQESPDKRTPDVEALGLLGRKNSKTSLGRRGSFYDPSKKSRNAEKYRMLQERMTSTKMLSPGPGSNISKCKSTPPRRIRPVSLFSALASPSPQKLPHTVGRIGALQDYSLFNDMKPEHLRLMQERMGSTNQRTSPNNKSAFHVRESPLKRIQPVRLLFGSPSPPKMPPGLTVTAKGRPIIRNLSFDSFQPSPSKTSRVTFSPKPSIQTMRSRDSPKKLMRTPTKLPMASGGSFMSPRSILKSPLRSPPHFNMYFTQQPSPLIGKAATFTPKGKSALCSLTPNKSTKVSPQGYVSGSKITPRKGETPKSEFKEAESPLRTPGRPHTRAVRKILAQLVDESPEKSKSQSLASLTGDKSSNNTVSSQDSEQIAVPLTPSKTPQKRTRRTSLRNLSPTSKDTPVGCDENVNASPGKLKLEAKSPVKRILSELLPSQDSDDLRSPRRRVGKRRRDSRSEIESFDESANLSADDNVDFRAKRQRSPFSSIAESNQGTPSKKRKLTLESDVASDSVSSDYFSTSEIFAASKELPEISTSGCAKFARFGSNSNDFDTSQAGMLRSRLRCGLSGTSDSNSNMSYDLPSSPVFTLAGPKNKSLERILSTGCETNTTDSEVSSRDPSPVFGKRVGELRGVTPTNFENIFSTGSPGKSPTTSSALSDLSVSPANSTRAKTSPGLKKYSPNVTAKGLAELINSPIHFETISPSVRKAASSSGTKDKSPTSSKVSAVTGEDESKPRSRRSLYRTETKSSM